jgi:hypothetical protein
MLTKKLSWENRMKQRFFKVISTLSVCTLISACGGGSSGESFQSDGVETQVFDTTLNTGGGDVNCQSLPRQGGIPFVSVTSSGSFGEAGFLQGAWRNSDGQIVATSGAKNAWVGDLIPVMSAEYVFAHTDPVEYVVGCGENAVTTVSTPQYDGNGDINGQAVFVSEGLNFSHQGQNLVLKSLTLDLGNGHPQTANF